MEWEMVAAIAHLITAVGVIPSLIYLAVQVRRENVERRRASVDSMTSKWGDVVRSINDSPDFGAIYLAGVQSFDDLPPVERLRFGAYLIRFFRYFEGMYFHAQDGALSQSLWTPIENLMDDMLAYPGVRSWWVTRRRWFSNELGVLVDRLIARDRTGTVYESYKLPKAAVDIGVVESPNLVGEATAEHRRTDGG